MSLGKSTSNRRHYKKQYCRHHKLSCSLESSQLTSLFQSLHGEVAESHSGLREELDKISSRVMAIEQGSMEPTSQEQSLPTASLQTATLEQSSNTPSNAVEQSLLIANPRILGQIPPNTRD